jgi:hypothetical protein
MRVDLHDEHVRHVGHADLFREIEGDVIRWTGDRTRSLANDPGIGMTERRGPSPGSARAARLAGDAVTFRSMLR